MRVLLAAEGESDEIVISSIIRHYSPDVQIDCKAFPSRGWHVVRRLAPSVSRAAYFGLYDVLVIHFDCDDLPVTGEGSRRELMTETFSETVSLLPEIARLRAVIFIPCAPCQSTDAWLTWGQQGGNGKSWEAMNRHQLKEFLYGSPPRRIRERAKEYSPKLVSRMQENQQWPQALRSFVGDWSNAVILCSTPD